MTSFDIEIEQILCNFEGCKVGECDGGYCKKEMQKRVSLISALLADRERRVIERVKLDGIAIVSIYTQWKCRAYSETQSEMPPPFDDVINEPKSLRRIVKLPSGN